MCIIIHNIQSNPRTTYNIIQHNIHKTTSCKHIANVKTIQKPSFALIDWYRTEKIKK